MLVKLTEPLYDASKPGRPRVFLFPAGALVDQSLADRFGGVYVQVKKATPAENKKRSPAENKGT